MFREKHFRNLGYKEFYLEAVEKTEFDWGNGGLKKI
jgi:hypothetical protein